MVSAGAESVVSAGVDVVSVETTDVELESAAAVVSVVEAEVGVCADVSAGVEVEIVLSVVVTGVEVLVSVGGVVVDVAPVFVLDAVEAPAPAIKESSCDFVMQVSAPELSDTQSSPV